VGCIVCTHWALLSEGWATRTPTDRAGADVAHVSCPAVLRDVDEGIEDALYDSQAIRGFVGIDLARESAPDATTLLKFRRLLNEHDLTERIFACINSTLSDKGLMLREITIVDATIIEAPSSTKNQKHERDPQMHQTKKSNQWHFSMKAHIGAEAHSGLIHTVMSTAVNAHDVPQAHALLHGQEQYGHGDAGYQGVDKREEMAKSKVRWFIAKRSLFELRTKAQVQRA